MAEAQVRQCWRVSWAGLCAGGRGSPTWPGHQALSQRLLTQDANVRNIKAFFSVKQAKFETRLDLPAAQAPEPLWGPTGAACRSATIQRLPVWESTMSARLSKSPGCVFGRVRCHGPAAHALNFVFTNTGSTPMTAQQTAGLQAANDYWSSKLSDPVTIYFWVSLPWAVACSGQASSLLYVKSYADVRNLLSADKTTAADATAVASLQAGNALSFWSTQGDGSARFDSDSSANNTGLLVSTANLKALGVKVNTAAMRPTHI